MLDRLFRILLRGLPAADYDEDDRAEMWSTYRARVERAAGGGGRFAQQGTKAGSGSPSRNQPAVDNPRHLSSTCIQIMHAVNA
jgi:hypothetical protein